MGNTVVFNRRKGVTSTYDQRILDYLESWGLSVTVIDDSDVATHNYTGVDLVIIGAADLDFVNHSAGATIAGLSKHVISMDRVVSRDNLGLATTAGWNSVSGMTVVDSTHDIIVKAKWEDAGFVRTGDVVGAQGIESLTTGTDFVCHQGTTLTARAALAIKLVSSYYKAHFGFHRFDTSATMCHAAHLLRATIEYIGLDVGPSITTMEPTDITETSIKFNASVYLGSKTSINIFFRYKEVSGSRWTNTTPKEVTSSGTVSETVGGLNPNTLYECKACIHNSNGKKIVFNRRDGATDTWDQELIDFLGVEGYTVAVIDDSALTSSYDFSSTALLIIGHRDVLPLTDHVGRFIFGSLNLPIISMARYVSAWELYMATDTWSGNVEYISGVDEDHEITKNLFWDTTYKRVFTEPVELEMMPTAALIANVNQLSGPTGTNLLVYTLLAELIVGKPKIHSGVFRLDIGRNEAFDLYTEILDYLNLESELTAESEEVRTLYAAPPAAETGITGLTPASVAASNNAFASAAISFTEVGSFAPTITILLPIVEVEITSHNDLAPSRISFTGRARFIFS